VSLFSVVVPTYQRAVLLERLLESIARQTTRDFEVLVIDDASGDEYRYERVIERFSGEYPLRYLRNDTNRGAQYSRNRGVSASNGELIAFVDDDDEWLPRKLEREAAVFGGAAPSVGLVYSWADAVAEDGAVVHRYRAVVRGNALREILEACFIPSPTVVVRRVVLEKVGIFDESLESCQDWDMWTRVVVAGFDIEVAEEVLALHHRHTGPSVGASPRSLEGYRNFYGKHMQQYERMGMHKNLSEKFRALAQQAARAGDRETARYALHRSIRLWMANWKAWVRYAQSLGGRRW